MAAFTTIALGITAAASVGSAIQSNKAAKAQGRAAEEQRKQQQLQAQRSRRQAIRQAQLQRAQAFAAGVGAGAQGGSGIAGGLSSLGSQVGGAMGYSTQMSGLSQNIGMFNQQAANAKARAGLFGAVGDLFSPFAGLPTKPQAMPNLGQGTVQ